MCYQNQKTDFDTTLLTEASKYRLYLDFASVASLTSVTSVT